MAFKIPNGFKMPTAVVRVKDSDGDLFDVDLLQAAIDLNSQLTFLIDEPNRQRTEGRNTAHQNTLAKNRERDNEIVRDDIYLRIAIRHRNHCGDGSELHALLADCKVPRAKWATFKPANVTATLAKKYGLSAPAIRAILKNWDERYHAS